MKGVVTKQLIDKGFGFIRTDAGLEYFFHRSACSPHEFDRMVVGTTVEFDPDEQAAKGPRAEEVRRA